MKMRYSLPLLIFLLLIIILRQGLQLNPAQLKSALLDKPAPSFALPDLFTHQVVTESRFKGQVTVVNVWATWCTTCAEEHGMLLALAKQAHIKFIGIDYKDNALLAKQWLNHYGNPYQSVLLDSTGQTMIDWGVYGTPESFIIDKYGIIRYKHIGPITLRDWETYFKPLIAELEKVTVDIHSRAKQVSTPRSL